MNGRLTPSYIPKRSPGESTGYTIYSDQVICLILQFGQVTQCLAREIAQIRHWSRRTRLGCQKTQLHLCADWVTLPRQSRSAEGQHLKGYSCRHEARIRQTGYCEISNDERMRVMEIDDELTSGPTSPRMISPQSFGIEAELNVGGSASPRYSNRHSYKPWIVAFVTCLLHMIIIRLGDNGRTVLVDLEMNDCCQVNGYYWAIKVTLVLHLGAT
jgi:hypothetical protein